MASAFVAAVQPRTHDQIPHFYFYFNLGDQINVFGVLKLEKKQSFVTFECDVISQSHEGVSLARKD